MKKILFVVRGYNPEISASGNLVKPLIEYLKLHAQVSVLCFTNGKCGTGIIDGIEVHRVLAPKIGYFERLMSIISRNLSRSTENVKLSNIMKKSIVELDERERFDFVIAITYEEVMALCHANIEKNRKFCFLLEKLPEPAKLKFIKKMQSSYNLKKIEYLSNSVSRVFCLPIVKSVYASAKIDFFELEHPMVVNRSYHTSHKTHSERIKLIYAGGLSKHQRNPMALVRLIQQLNCKVGVDLDIYSYGFKFNENFVKKISDNIRVNKTVEPKFLNSKINDADFIVTIGNKEVDIFPSKLFDCVSTGKPIIHFFQNSKDQYLSYLQKYPLSMSVDYNKCENAETLEAILKFLTDIKGERLPFNLVSRDFFDCTPGYVGDLMLREIKACQD
ncbi:hypothetical protein I6M34_07200 [Shewanella algae]|uniref:hypothetical protein n=1 Tax=Shewanella algae TaxID=38313 RepID=UPI001AADBF65|nr:hypothetical protein [Shewanella algae]MBO2602901.1 hypothetical protein [Shewanella algae]